VSIVEKEGMVNAWAKKHGLTEPIAVAENGATAREIAAQLDR
jgi:hypothetical protein